METQNSGTWSDGLGEVCDNLRVLLTIPMLLEDEREIIHFSFDTTGNPKKKTNGLTLLIQAATVIHQVQDMTPSYIDHTGHLTTLPYYHMEYGALAERSRISVGRYGDRSLILDNVSRKIETPERAMMTDPDW